MLRPNPLFGNLTTFCHEALQRQSIPNDCDLRTDHSRENRVEHKGTRGAKLELAYTMPIWSSALLTSDSDLGLGSRPRLAHITGYPSKLLISHRGGKRENTTVKKKREKQRKRIKKGTCWTLAPTPSFAAVSSSLGNSHRAGLEPWSFLDTTSHPPDIPCSLRSRFCQGSRRGSYHIFGHRSRQHGDFPFFFLQLLPLRGHPTCVYPPQNHKSTT